MHNANYNIGDLITRINNGSRAGLGVIKAPYNKENYQVLNELVKLGVVQNFYTLIPSKTSNSEITKSLNLNSVKRVLVITLLSTRVRQGQEALQTISSPNDYSEGVSVNPWVKSMGCSSEGVKAHLNLISKPGKRIYISYKNICNFNNGFKQYLIRTSKGIISSQTALKYKIGGELLLKISFASAA